VTKPRPVGNRAAELLDQAIKHLQRSREQLKSAEVKQDRNPDLAALMRRDVGLWIAEAEILTLRVRTGQYEE
jgi:hypothetical protein